MILDITRKNEEEQWLKGCLMETLEQTFFESDTNLLTSIVGDLLQDFIVKKVEEVIEGRHYAVMGHSESECIEAQMDGRLDELHNAIYDDYLAADTLTMAVYEVLSERPGIEVYLETLFVIDCINVLNDLSIFYIADNMNSYEIKNPPLTEVW